LPSPIKGEGKYLEGISNGFGQDFIFKLHFLLKYNTLPGSKKKAGRDGNDLAFAENGRKEIRRGGVL
jgi:hypothetical protein